MFRNIINKFLIFCIMLLLLLNLCSCKTIEIDVHMFSEIEECVNVKDFKVDNSEVELYDSSMDDKHLDKLEFQESFGCKYTSDYLTFELFAYVFSSNDIAMNYFINITGKQSDPNPTFLDSSGSSSFSRVVVSENKAYAIYCKKADKEKVITFLNSWFSVDITDDLKKEGKTGERQGTVLCLDKLTGQCYTIPG